MHLFIFSKYVTEQNKIIRMMLYKHCFRLQYLLFLLLPNCSAPLPDPLIFIYFTTDFLVLLPEV